MWPVIRTILPPPPPKWCFLRPVSNRFHAQHSSVDWSQNMLQSRWGRNRLMIYTFYSTSLEIGFRHKILILKLAGGDSSLSVWQSSGLSIAHMAARAYIWLGTCKSQLKSVIVLSDDNTYIHTWSASVDSDAKYGNIDVWNFYNSWSQMLTL
jgi:hypothetical protein